jgi:hypothetical protein
VLLTALTPAQVSHAYGVDQIMFGSIKGDGTGQTIAIVNAYDAPNIESDLAAFNKAFGLPTTDGTGGSILTIAKPQGEPAYDTTWAQESTTDVEWAHAIAPGAHILLVEASSSSPTSLLAAVDYARNQPGVSVVSMSWGFAEFASETSYDSILTTPAGHTGVSFVTSSGDTGGIVQWPAVSPNVVSVGGTTLATTDNQGTYGSETAWSGSGGGVSAYETKPDYQSGVMTTTANRAGPDVAYVASPSSGAQVYFTPSGGSGGWYTFGGTSIGAPQWAAIIAIANQGRAINGQGALDGRSQLLPALYNMPASNFHDIVSGSATNGSTINAAGPGYDLATGRGSPYANLVVRDLVNATANGLIAAPPLVGTVTTSAQSAALTYGTAGTTTYTITVNRGTGTGAFDAGLSVTAGLPAGATYSFTVGGSVSSTLHFGDSDTSLTATLTIGNAATTPAGSFAFTVTAERLDANGDLTGDLATAAGTLTVSPRELTVTADAKTKTAGSADPAFTWQLTSGTLVGGDSLTGALARAPGEDVGTYAIGQGTLSAGSNYSLTFVGSTLTILPAAAYDLSGPWTTGGKLASISQSGNSLTLTDPAGVTSTGSFTSASQITGRSGLTATIDTSTADQGRILWSDGTIWLRVSVGGEYYNPANNQLTSVLQDGTRLTFVNAGGGTSTGSLLGANQVAATDWNQSATFQDGMLTFANGNVWTKLNLSPTYTNAAGDRVGVIQNSANTGLVFVNKAGGTSSGSWLSPTQISATDWGVTGTVRDGQILWSNGSVWNKNLVASATGGGAGLVSVTATNAQIILTNKSGGTSRAEVTAAGTLVALDWGGVTGTQSNGRIVWSNGTVWDNFDFNALDAVFSDIRTYPFGS